MDVIAAALPLLALGVLTAVTLSIDVQLPRRGTIPAGHAVAIAVAAHIGSTREFAIVAAATVAVLHPVLLARRRDDVVRRLLATAGALAAAGAAAAAVRPHVPAAGTDGWARAALLAAFAIGIAYSIVDLALSRREQPSVQSLREASPVYLSLLCSAALLAMASGWMLVFAALPVVITKYSFERYHAARRTYEQTIQALGIVPELAGHVALGHGERTAHYAAELATELGLAPAVVEHVATAARLHHVGHVAVPDLDDTVPGIDEDSVVAATSGRILRESGFAPEIVALVEGLGHHTGPGSLPDAALLVATSFDDLVGDDPGRVGGAVAILTGRGGTGPWTVAVDALCALVARDPDVVPAAVARGEPLVVAAAAAGERVGR